MPDPTELDELESGLTSGFYVRFHRYAHEQWGPSGKTYLDAIQRAISGGQGTEAESVARLKMIAHTQQAITDLFQWPINRVATLKNQKAAHAQAGGTSRRGPGL